MAEECTDAVSNSDVFSSNKPMMTTNEVGTDVDLKSGPRSLTLSLGSKDRLSQYLHKSRKIRADRIPRSNEIHEIILEDLRGGILAILPFGTILAHFKNTKVCGEVRGGVQGSQTYVALPGWRSCTSGNPEGENYKGSWNTDDHEDFKSLQGPRSLIIYLEKSKKIRARMLTRLIECYEIIWELPSGTVSAPLKRIKICGEFRGAGQGSRTYGMLPGWGRWEGPGEGEEGDEGDEGDDDEGRWNTNDEDGNQDGDNARIPIEFDGFNLAPVIEKPWVRRARLDSYDSLAQKIHEKYLSWKISNFYALRDDEVATIEEPWPFLAVSYMSQDNPPITLDHTIPWHEFSPKLACIRLRKLAEEEHLTRYPHLIHIVFDTVPPPAVYKPYVKRHSLEGYPSLVQGIFDEYLLSINNGRSPPFVPTIGEPWPGFRAVYVSNGNPPVTLDSSVPWEEFNPRLALIRLQNPWTEEFFRLQNETTEDFGTDNEHLDSDGTFEFGRDNEYLDPDGTFDFGTDNEYLDPDGTFEEDGEEDANNAYGGADDNGEDARGEDLLPADAEANRDSDHVNGTDDEDQQEEHAQKDK